MKIAILDLSPFRHADYHQFMTQVKKLVDKYGAEALGVDIFFAYFIQALDNVSTAMAVEEGSSITPAVQDADWLRDSDYRCLRYCIMSYFYSRDTDKQQAAEKLWRIVDQVGNPTNLALNAETSVIEQLYTQLSAYPEAIETLGIQEMMDYMCDSNQAFAQVAGDRYSEKSERPSGDVKAARGKLDTPYRNIVSSVNMMLTTDKQADYLAFTNEMNTLVGDYKKLIAERKSHRKTDKTD